MTAREKDPYKLLAYYLTGKCVCTCAFVCVCVLVVEGVANFLLSSSFSFPDFLLLLFTVEIKFGKINRVIIKPSINFTIRKQ